MKGNEMESAKMMIASYAIHILREMIVLVIYVVSDVVFCNCVMSSYLQGARMVIEWDLVALLAFPLYGK